MRQLPGVWLTPPPRLRPPRSATHHGTDPRSIFYGKILSDARVSDFFSQLDVKGQKTKMVSFLMVGGRKRGRERGRERGRKRGGWGNGWGLAAYRPCMDRGDRV